MIFKYPYRQFPTAQGGIAYAAVVDVQLSLLTKNAQRTKRLECLVDSGSSRCLFHASIGQAMGLDVRTGLLDQALGISGRTTDTYLHAVMLYIPGGPVKVSAGFSYELPLAGLLGMDGFFEHFRVVFDSAARVLEWERLHKT